MARSSIPRSLNAKKCEIHWCLMIFAPRKRPKRYPALQIHGTKIQIRIENARNFVKKGKIELVLESAVSHNKQSAPVKLANSISATKLLKNFETITIVGANSGQVTK